MKILVLDIYKNTQYRLSKDTSGGYGTGNDFGDSIFTNFLKKYLKKIHDWPPLFAVYSYSVLLDKGFDVDFCNEIPKNFESYDLFIVTSSIVCCETELEILKNINLKKKNCSFVIGPFATNNPEIYNEVGATVISGEPEFYFMKNENFYNDLKKKIVYVKSEYDLDDLPLPKWQKLRRTTKTLSKLFGNYPSLPIIATRGCPYSCYKYCVYPLQQGRKVRQRSPKKIVDEIEFFKKKLGVEMFIFRDPVFSINRKHTIELAEQLIKRNIKVKFVIETHLRILDEELIQILKKAGLVGCKVGVESADEEVLMNSNRFTIKKDKQLEKIRELEKNKIKVSAMYILGFPTDTNETILKTINYAKKLNTTYAQFSIWTPYPGTPIFSQYKDKIFVKKYEDFNQYKLVYDHDNLNNHQIRRFLEEAYEKFYLRISWLTKFLIFKNNE